MKGDYDQSFEVLGLKPGAGEDEIKRAYFRLVRQYPPEKDPEKFQRIRRAYEILKEGPPAVDELVFPIPEDPSVRFWVGHAGRLLEEGDEKTAADCLSEALKFDPNDPFLLLNLAKMQLRAGNPRKAAKTAQKLAELKPDFAEAHAIAAVGLHDGSWYKKALPEFRKAYQLGWRDFDFLLNYGDAAQANGQSQEAEHLRRDLLEKTKWDRTNLDAAIYLYAVLMMQVSAEKDSLLAVLKEYDQFLRSCRRLLKERNPEELIAPFMNACARRPSVLMSHVVYREMDSLFETTEIIRNTHHNQDLLEYRRNLLLGALEHDRRLKDTLWLQLAVMRLETYEDSKLQRFAFLDTLLCLMKEGEKSRQMAMMLRQEYPFLVDQMGETLELFALKDQEGQFQKFKKEYARLSEDYSGGVFYERFPEEKELPRGTLAYIGDTPFVRETKKPGRNDPCPCGSGKKYKKCCLGKGIYD